jgi:cytochrome P450
MKVGKELLRYEPPVQLLQSRTALTDVDVAGVTVMINGVCIRITARRTQSAVKTLLTASHRACSLSAALLEQCA